MKNKKGQTLLLSILVGAMIFAFGMLIINFLMSDVDDIRNSLDCTNTTITDGTKLTCLGADSVIIYLIVTIISVAGGVIASRILL